MGGGHDGDSCHDAGGNRGHAGDGLPSGRDPEGRLDRTGHRARRTRPVPVRVQTAGPWAGVADGGGDDRRPVDRVPRPGRRRPPARRLRGAIGVCDGVAARSVGLTVQRQIADTWSVASRARAWLTWHAQEQAIIIGYVPVGGSDPTQGIIIRWPELACYPIRWASIAPTIGSVLDIPTGLTIGELTNPIGTMTLTLGELDTTVSRLTLGGSTGQSYKDDGGDDDGVAFPAHFETGLSSLGGRTWK